MGKRVDFFELDDTDVFGKGQYMPHERPCQPQSVFIFVLGREAKHDPVLLSVVDRAQLFDAHEQIEN
jgi:hypothetical protein